MLFPSVLRNFGTLAGVPSNVDAVEASLLFANRIHSFVALVGPSGWGKTHLMEAAANHMLQDHGIMAHSHTAVEYAVNPHLTELPGPLLLDNVQDALQRPRLRQNLRLTLERRVKSGRATLLSFTANRPSRHIKAILPCCREWTIATIGSPDPCERMVVIGQLAASEGVAISQGLARLLAYKMRGNGRTLVGALKRLRMEGQQWLDSRSTLRACGILDPFFADNSGWDLKEQIERIAQQPEFRSTREQQIDLAVYTMSCEACLHEADIARFLQISPCQVYARALRFEKRASECEAARVQLSKFIETIVDSLMRE